jgi:hypothetical protein
MHVKYKRTGPHDFEITYPKVGPFGSPSEELQKITDKLPLELTVLVSGGADSEVMAKWFARAGKIVTAVAYRIIYEGRLVNEHDLEWVKELDNICPIVYKDFDLKKFWESPWFDAFVGSTKCTSPQLPLHAMLAIKEEQKSFVILPSIHPEPKFCWNATYVQEREKDYIATKHLSKYRKIMVSPLRANSEIIASIMTSPEFRDFDKFGLADGRARKPEQYMEYFGIDIKPRPKYHGFEGSEDLDNGMRQKIWDKYKHSEVHMYIPAKEMLWRMMMGDTTYSTHKYKKIVYEGVHLVGPAQ